MPDSPESPPQQSPTSVSLAADAASRNVIQVRGARQHNLQGIDLDIPRDQLVVITGVSGSGKSSLAFDTLYAEGQRRYLEHVALRVRPLIDRLEPPDCDSLEGLPPTLCVRQVGTAPHARHTVATATEVYDLLRVLYARAGLPHCPDCGQAIVQQPAEAIVEQILALETGRKVMLLAPLVRGRKGTHADLLERAGKEGFVRVRIDGEIHDLTALPKIAKGRPHDIEVVVDRIVVKEGIRSRLAESVQHALKHGDGACIVSAQAGAGWDDHLYSSRFACPDCGTSFAEIEPRTLNFNSPYGACLECAGLGTIDTDDDSSAEICPSCAGARIGPVGRGVTIDALPLHQFLSRSIADALAISRGWEQQAATEDSAAFTEIGRRVAASLLQEITPRLAYLERVGTGYLTLDRSLRSLSGGEFQRVRLAGALGASLIGVCYVLDEPSTGLHPRDTHRLYELLCELRDQGNSVVVVEHDLDLLGGADHIIDLGPGAGTEGGRVVAAGSVAEIRAADNSLTGRALREIEHRDRTLRSIEAAPRLTIHEATLHNLQNLTVEIPLERLVCVTGVSGSGKSSLITQTLLPLLRASFNGNPPAEGNPRGWLSGQDQLSRLAVVDQSPLGRSGRSNPATASGLWDFVRKVFAQTREARLRGFRSRRFSFNSPAGRCPECRGQGTRRLDMRFLPDVLLTCPACRGARFNPQTLSIRFRGKNVADVLAMRIDEARLFFENVPRLAELLETFAAVGLGYLTLGQSALTLSGGEAQRIKLATELARPRSPGTLFVLDEPTAGLHHADVERLLALLQQLVDQGHSVLVIEHHSEVIAAADWVIDLGPEAGPQGGQIVAAGTPSDLMQIAASHTGRALTRAF